MPERDEHSVNSRHASAAATAIATATRRDAAIAIVTASLTADRRSAVQALFALDDRLRGIVATTSQPMIGQLRLAWWRDALARLDDGPAPAEPLLVALKAHVLPYGVSGDALADLVECREAELLDDDDCRTDMLPDGAAKFLLAAKLLGATSVEGVAAAGQAWVLAERAASARNAAEAAVLVGQADELLRLAFARRWSKPTRPLGVLALLARFAVDPDGSRTRYLMRVMRFRMTGR